MKKLFLAIIVLFSFSLVGKAQDVDKADRHRHKMAVVKHERREGKVVRMERHEAETTTAAPGRLKADGTPDRRYTENRHLKNDGTRDRRFKENKHLTKSGEGDRRYKEYKKAN